MPQPPHQRRTQPIRRPAPGRWRPNWDAAVDAFLAEARRKNLTPATIEHYRTYLCGVRARQFVRDHKITGVEQVTPEVLRAFEEELFRIGLSAGSVRLYHKVLLNFVGFCRREGWCDGSEVIALKGPKLPRKEPEVFTVDEERRLLDAARSERDRFLIEFLIATGVRLRELVSITLDDLIDAPDGRVLRVRQGKGRKDRIVPLETERNRFVKRLREYIDTIRPRDTDERALFLSTRRVNGVYPPLSANGVQTLFDRLRKGTGISHAHVHTARHTFATRALRAGITPLVLRRVLGHTSVAMTDRYVHYQSSDLVKAWKARSD